jgi:hypothetical protein
LFFASLHGVIAGRAELAAALLSELARALGEKLGDEVKQAFADLLKRLSELLPLVGASLDFATGWSVGRLFSAGGDWSKKLVSTLATGPTLDALRQKLRRVLANLEQRRVLVVIDDLDRLTPIEAVEMTSLVKSLGDLPNVIYLLSYDEMKLIDLINKGLGVDGRDFLEKIVQYPVHLPPIANEDLVRLLDSDLSALLGELSDADKRRWISKIKDLGTCVARMHGEDELPKMF